MSVSNAFNSSQLDYCNSLFRSLSIFNLHRLESIQNSAARIVTNLSKYTRITLLLRKLHWLPVQFHSEFKLATLVYKFIHTGFRKYFSPYLSAYRTTYNTRHSQSVANFLMYQNFKLQFTSPLSSLASVLPLMLPLFGIHFLKTFMHHPLLAHPLLAQNLSLRKGISFLAHFLLWLRSADLFLSLDFEFAYCYYLVAPYSPLLSGD